MAEDGVTVQLIGKDDIVASFNELREYIKGNPFSQAVRSAAQLMLQDLISRAPVDSGRLVSNLRIAVRRAADAVHARIVVNTAGSKEDAHNAFYWRFVEFGHRTRNDGGIGFVSPRPFITPAFEGERELVAQAVIDAFNEAIEKAAQRAARAR